MVRLDGLTPLIYMEIAPTDPESKVNLLMYGHLGAITLYATPILMNRQAAPFD